MVIFSLIFYGDTIIKCCSSMDPMDSERINIEFTCCYVNNKNKFSALEEALAGYTVTGIDLNGGIAYHSQIRTCEFLAFVQRNIHQWDLKYLRFEQTQFDLDDIERYGSIFDNLEKLDLTKCDELDFGAYQSIIIHSPKLKRLILKNLDDFDADYALYAVSGQLDSLYLEKVKRSGNGSYKIIIGGQLQYLELYDVSINVDLKITTRHLRRLFRVENFPWLRSIRTTNIMFSKLFSHLVEHWDVRAKVEIHGRRISGQFEMKDGSNPIKFTCYTD